jgi:hypothetical protein
VKSLGIEDVRIHDLRHTGPSVLLMQGISGDVVRKITGHRSRGLERYQHLSPGLQGSDCGLDRPGALSDTPSDTPAPEEGDENIEDAEVIVPEGEIGGVDGTRTPSVSEAKRDGFASLSEADPVTRDLRH